MYSLSHPAKKSVLCFSSLYSWAIKFPATLKDFPFPLLRSLLQCPSCSKALSKYLGIYHLSKGKQALPVKDRERDSLESHKSTTSLDSSDLPNIVQNLSTYLHLSLSSQTYTHITANTCGLLLQPPAV